MNPTVRRNVTCWLLLILCSCLSVVAQDAAVAPQPIAIDGAQSRVYKSVDGGELRLHIFNPPNRVTVPAVPAIVFFFGGGWTGGTVTQFAPQSNHLARRGMTAIVADYRVFGRHKTGAFEAIADAKSAIRWVRAHATELGIDPARIAAGGGSSGGHIALAAAVLEGFDELNENRSVSSKPSALVLFNPAVDTTSENGARIGGTVRDTLGARFGDRGRDGSPIHHLSPRLPPTIVLHGKADTTVPYADVERFCSEMTKFGNDCQLVGYDGATHGFFNPRNDDGKWYRATLLEADRFLTQIGYLKGPVPTQIP
ncbi:MAG TPA: alpha/beta hydrolase [Gemmatimonadales bacterium]|nr:alpha/beta hydrolase [Gemmatimonadales bacterium]